MLPLPCLMLVTGRSLCGGEDGLVRAVDEAVSGGVDAVQLREKDLPPAELQSLARRLRDITRGCSLLLVNGNVDVAAAMSADGVHLPEDASAAVRPREGFLIGRSVHSVGAARRAEAEGPDYLIAGPVYETGSHPGAPAAGPELIEAVARTGARPGTRVVRAPVLAIGGVTSGRVEEVVRAGASGVAVVSAILGARDRRSAAQAMREALDAAWAGAKAVR